MHATCHCCFGESGEQRNTPPVLTMTYQWFQGNDQLPSILATTVPLKEVPPNMRLVLTTTMPPELVVPQLQQQYQRTELRPCLAVTCLIVVH